MLSIILTIFSVLITAILSVLGWFIKEKLGDLKDTDKRLETKLDKIGDVLFGVVDRVSKIEGKLFGVAVSGSPVRLTPLGQEVLRDSGILNILENRKDGLIKKIQTENLPTAYDVQEHIKKLVTSAGLSLSEEEENQLKAFAFKKGITLEDVFFAGAIYFRDVVLGELKMKIEDLDRNP